MTVTPGPSTASTGEIFAALLSPEGMADPYPQYAALHELGEVVRIGSASFVAVSFDAVNAVLRDPAFRVTPMSAGDPGMHPAHFPGSLLSTNGAVHSRVRGLMAGVFTARRIGALAPSVERIADGLLAGMADFGAGGRPVDFMAAFAYLLPVNVICELLGVPEPDRATFRPEARKLAIALDFSNDQDALATADAAAVWLQDYFAGLVAERRRAPAGDLISALVSAVDTGAAGTDAPAGGALGQAGLLVNLTLLLFAGFETTTNLLGNGLAVLLSRPQLAAGLRDGSVAPDAFVTEVLRFDAPVQAATDRWRNEAGAVAGTEMAAGAHVTALIGAANRDPRRFSSPDTFDPARPDAGALSFGAGAHYCLGAALARLEGTIAFPRLLAAFSRISLAGAPVRRQGLVLRGFDQLPVAVSPR